MKKILFTGARSGISGSVIEKIANNDYFIYLTVHKENEVKTAKEKYGKYKNITIFKLDITDQNDRNKLKGLDLDIIVLNAAVGFGGFILDIDMNNFRENYEVNVFSNVECIKIVLTNMLMKKKGKIIIMTSLAGVYPIAFLGSYASTKASLIMIAKILRKEVKLINKNIKIKIVEPGVYKTGFNEVMLDNKDLDSSKFYSSVKDKVLYKEYLMFDLFASKSLDSIDRQIINAIESNNNKFSYKAPWYSALIIKLYSVFWNK